MAITLSTLESYMVAEGLKFSLHDDYIRTSFATDLYRDQEGDPSVFIIARIEENGEYFKLMAPNLYHYPPDGPNASEVFRILLGVCWRSKLIKYEYDERDGEIRAIVEFPLEDATLTPKQFLRCLNGLVQIIDEYHEAIATAIAGATASLDDAEEAADNIRKADRILRAAGIDRITLAAEAPGVIRFEE
ncbi:MAG: hypothetical protein JXM71_06480 [Spirochaetales bacterium]|nr:hypothetical protein [Spirochaetales bacterium]